MIKPNSCAPVHPTCPIEPAHSEPRIPSPHTQSRGDRAAETEPHVVNSRWSHGDRDAAARSTNTLGVVHVAELAHHVVCVHVALACNRQPKAKVGEFVINGAHTNATSCKAVYVRLTVTRGN
jgi:hypothetical protein